MHYVIILLVNRILGHLPCINVLMAVYMISFQIVECLPSVYCYASICGKTNFVLCVCN